MFVAAGCDQDTLSSLSQYLQSETDPVWRRFRRVMYSDDIIGTVQCGVTGKQAGGVAILSHAENSDIDATPQVLSFVVGVKGYIE